MGALAVSGIRRRAVDSPQTGGVTVRSLSRRDLDDVARIDALHTGTSKRRYWRAVFDEFLGRAPRRDRVRLGAEVGGVLAGYLLAEVRAFEFGSPPCGWVFAVGVDPGRLRRGLASALLDEACRRFRQAKVSQVRTMVRRTDVPVLSFFRASGFVGGPFVQLERDLPEGGARPTGGRGGAAAPEEDR
ncbi:MAG TPA: GNAT family N-acetyltransferase [Candidatus Polarisedimenticolia bacterium]|nr:GNAT family N-acetyltransferase [Candidatus Polarisedimenticolia bacterium]